MEEVDLTPPNKNRDESPGLRWAIRGLLLLCMALISTVLMSEPRIAGKIKELTGMASERLRVSEQTSEAEQSQEAERPAVKQLPNSSVPVRRAGE
ncbi:MAG: hypothetical protein AB3N11_17265 [Arenibacterium sp.]